MMTYYSSHTENEVYYYHGDLCGSRAQSQVCLSYAEMQQSVRSKHLGSASWITDIGGTPVQHLQYLPFGQPYVDKRTSGYSERFRFTGKERDEETGYGYFGARYMDHELMTMWLSVDPMADKYPSISPYAYCAWNPVKLVDPDGMDTGYYNVQGDPLFTRNGGDNVNMMVVTDKFRMSYDKYLEGNYHSFDVKTISINKMDGMYDYSDESGKECYYSVKGDGQHRNMQKGDNKTVHEASFDDSDQYNVHTHCRDIMDSDGSIKDVGGTNPSYNKDQAGIGDKFGIILGYKKVNTTINFGTCIKSSSAPNNVKLVRAVGFYGKNGPLCNSVDYNKFRETIIKLQK